MHRTISLTLAGIDIYKFSRLSSLILSQDFRSAVSSCLKLCGSTFLSLMVSLRIDYIFSKRFRSGEMGGHSSLCQKLILWSFNHLKVVQAVWVLAPSCIKIISDIGWGSLFPLLVLMVADTRVGFCKILTVKISFRRTVP